MICSVQKLVRFVRVGFFEKIVIKRVYYGIFMRAADGVVPVAVVKSLREIGRASCRERV